MAQPEGWSNPNTTRSRIVLEIAAELVGRAEQPLRQAKVLLRSANDGPWERALFGSATMEGIDDVARGGAVLAVVNPSTALRMAYLGTPPFGEPRPVRLLAVIPSADQLAFAVRADTGLTRFEEIGERRFPLHVRTRGMSRHSLQFMIARVAEAAGFGLDDLAAWGGSIVFDGGFPYMHSPVVAAVQRGEVEALFEEGCNEWLPAALDAGMTVLPLAEGTLIALEAAGFRRAVIRKTDYPQLEADIATVSFSGWPIFVHAELDDAFVRQCCEALEARKALIPWQGEGPLPVERMCVDAEDTPIDIPFHPAAERYWRERGYLTSGSGAAE